MSAFKENLQRGIFLSKQQRSLKNLYESSNFYATQTGFGETKLTRKASEGRSMQTSLMNFHKTIAVSQSSGGWIRPQSKHANRNAPNRPQTSKGSRKQPLQGNMMLFSTLLKNPQQQTKTLHKTSTTTTGKKIFKRGSNINTNKIEENKQSQEYQHDRSAQLGQLMMFNNWEKYEPRGFDRSQQREEDENVIHDQDNIEIVVNRRTTQQGQQKSSTKKGPSLHRNKFETDLDDEFLELFAN